MAMTDDFIKHQIFLQRLAGTEAKRLSRELTKLLNAAKSEAVSNNSLTAIKTKLRELAKSLASVGIKGVEAIATYELEFNIKMLNKHIDKDIKSPPPVKLEKALADKNMEINNISRKGTRKSLLAAYNQFARAKADELTQIISDSRAMSLSMQDTLAKLTERSIGLQLAQAKTLSRTAVNYVSNVARDVAIKENSDFIHKVIWVSVLDSGTTEYCEEHDGNIYEVGEGPRPPAHYGCRSMVEPYEG